MKTTLLFLSVFLSVSLFGQYDIRKVHLGMSMNDVISAEYPNKPKRDGNNIEFENVDFGGGLTAKLKYRFYGGKLDEILYIVYGPEYNRGTCRNIIPFQEKVDASYATIRELKSNGFDIENWMIRVEPKMDRETYESTPKHTTFYTLDKITNDSSDYNTVPLDTRTIRIIDAFAKANSSTNPGIWGHLYEDEKKIFGKWLVLTYNEYQNSDWEDNIRMFPEELELYRKEKLERCYESYNNTLFWVKIKE